MLEYLDTGFYYMRSSVLLSVILFILYQFVFKIILVRLGGVSSKQYAGERQAKGFRKKHIIRMLSEYIFILWVCTILKTTGIIGMSLQPDIRWDMFAGSILSIPFAGASMRMILLNVMLFIPYGFLLCLAFPSKKWNWKRVLLIGILTSVCIEGIQIFSGRMFELDDIIANGTGTLIGSVLYRICKQFYRKEYRKGILTVAGLAAVCSIACLSLSFLANGDVIRQREEEMYPGIFDDEQARDDIKEIRLISKENMFTANDLMEADAAFEWSYDDVATLLDNQIALYRFESGTWYAEDLISQSEDCFVEIFYDTSHDFHFYNRQDWEMTGVRHLLYDASNGSFWYGGDDDLFNCCAVYEDAEYPYVKDAELNDIIMSGTVDLEADEQF